MQNASQDTSQMGERKEYRTLRSGRAVYADGGIKPDVRVDADTTQVSDYMVKVIAQGAYNDFVLGYLDKHRARLTAAYPTFEKFDAEFELSDEDMSLLVECAKAKGVEYDALGYKQSLPLIKIQLSAIIAQRLYSVSEYYRYINPRINDSFKKSLWLLNNWESEAEPLLN
jgi:carboxyl-terminal processing protease